MNKNIIDASLAIKEADALLIGISNGLSIAEGYHIFANNDMFRRQFGDFQRKYGIQSVIEGCFFHYPTDEDRQAFLKCLIHYWIKEYQPSDVMKDLLAIVGAKDYFILTSNGDKHLELSGFNSDKIFEIEGSFYDLQRGLPPKNRNSELNRFLQCYHGKRLVILELGIGRYNRLIKPSLIQLAFREPHVKYIILNLAGEISFPEDNKHMFIPLAGDMAVTLQELRKLLD